MVGKFASQHMPHDAFMIVTNRKFDEDLAALDIKRPPARNGDRLALPQYA